MIIDNPDQHLTSALPVSKLVGLALISAGIVVLGGAVLQVYWFLTRPEMFAGFQTLLPERIVVVESEMGTVLLPREFLMYGVPLSLLSLVGKIGGELLSRGVDFLEPVRRRSRPPSA